MSTSIGPIEIRVPSDPGLSGMLRLAAGGVASLADYSVDQIDDIDIVVGEVFSALIEHGSGNLIDVHLSVDDMGFHVSGHTAADSFDIHHPDLVVCGRVLEGLGAQHGFDVDSGFARIWATVQPVSTGIHS